jgi:hypothetical protein
MQKNGISEHIFPLLSFPKVTTAAAFCAPASCVPVSMASIMNPASTINVSRSYGARIQESFF